MNHLLYYLFRPLAAIFILLSIPFTGSAQTVEQITGNWKGAIEVPGMTLELSIELQQKNGAWTGALDIPVQNIDDMALTELTIAGDSIRFKLPEVPGSASFRGAFQDEVTWIRGDFTQMGQTFPMALQKESEAEKAAEADRLARAVAQIKVLTDSFRTLQQVPGIGIGILKDGEVLLAEGFGYRDQEKEMPVTARTRFAIGSSSKAFTATGVALLADDGKLEWDDKVIDHLPDFRLMDEFATQEMTPVDLLSHQSGLPRHDFMWYGSPFSREEIYQRLRYLEPNKSFRSTWQYQNLMYLTAGVLIERLSGQSWEDYTRERLFEPLGMTQTGFSQEDETVQAEVALPYFKQEEAVITIPYRNISAVGPAGSIYSNVEDMLKWVRFNLDGGKVGEEQVLAKDQLARLHRPVKVLENSRSPQSPELSDRTYGLGWFLYQYDGIDVVQHGGNIDGFSAYVFLLPRENVGMVLLTNLNGTPLPGVLAMHATDLLLGREPTDWYARVYGEDKEEEEEEDEAKEEAEPIAGTRPSHPVKDFLGEYEHPGYGVVTIYQEADTLKLKFNAFDAPITHWHYNVYQIKIEEFGQDMLATFYTNKDGLIDRLSLPIEPSLPEDIFFDKLPPDVLSDEAYVAAITGKYDLQGQQVTIKMENDKLYAVVPGQPQYELEATKENWFKLKDLNGFSVEFIFEEGVEKAVRLKFHQPNGVFAAERES